MTNAPPSRRYSIFWMPAPPVSVAVMVTVGLRHQPKLTVPDSTALDTGAVVSTVNVDVDVASSFPARSVARADSV